VATTLAQTTDWGLGHRQFSVDNSRARAQLKCALLLDLNRHRVQADRKQDSPGTSARERKPHPPVARQRCRVAGIRPSSAFGPPPIRTVHGTGVVPTDIRLMEFIPLLIRVLDLHEVNVRLLLSHAGT
jgi:hypothetical protein